jgi:hypothetical protein
MDESNGRRRSGAKNQLKIVVGIMAVGFAVTLALVVGNRLSDEALAVLSGAVCGVGAAIPTSLLVAVVSRRRDEQRNEERGQRGAATTAPGSYPPVIVVAPPSGPQYAGDWRAIPSAAPWWGELPERRFTVVGEPATDVHKEVIYERYA